MPKTLPVNFTNMPIILEGIGFFVELPHDVNERFKKLMQEAVTGAKDVTALEKRLKRISPKAIRCKRGRFSLAKEPRPLCKSTCFTYRIVSDEHSRRNIIARAKEEPLSQYPEDPHTISEDPTDELFEEISPEEFEAGNLVLAELIASQQEDPASFYSRMMQED